MTTDTNMRTERRFIRLWPSFFTLFVFYILFYTVCALSDYNGSGRIFGWNFNLVAYAVSFLGACACAAAACGVSLLLGRALETKAGRVAASAVISLGFLGAVFWLYAAYRYETIWFAGEDLSRSFFREQIEHKDLYFLLMAPAAILAARFLPWEKLVCRKKAVRAVWAVLIAAVFAALTYAPNIFKNNMWGMYHADAYINSIINTAHFVPYSDSTASIYGHYGLIYLPFVKLLGNDLGAVTLTIALFVFLLYLAEAYIADYLIENDAVFCITLLALGGTGTTFFGQGQYWQTYPHRLLFPMLTAAALTALCKEKLKKGRVLFFVLGTLSVIFNLETGLICLMILAAFFFLRDWGKRKLIPSVLAEALCCLLCLAGAYLLVNLYNLLCGGGWNSPATFIFPIASSSYDMFEILRGPLSDGRGSFVLALVVLSSAFLYSAVRIFQTHASADRGRWLILMSLSLSGLGLFTYYIDRPAPSCLSISHMDMLLLLGAACPVWCQAQKTRPSFSEPDAWFRTRSSLLSLALVLYFAVECVIGYGAAFSDRKQTVWQTGMLKESLETARREIPEDARGVFVGELYYALGRDTMVYTIDMADFNTNGYNAVIQEMQNADRIVIADETMDGHAVQVIRDELGDPDAFEESVRGNPTLPFQRWGFTLEKQIITPCFTLSLYNKSN